MARKLLSLKKVTLVVLQQLQNITEETMAVAKILELRRDDLIDDYDIPREKWESNLEDATYGDRLVKVSSFHNLLKRKMTMN